MLQVFVPLDILTLEKMCKLGEDLKRKMVSSYRMFAIEECCNNLENLQSLMDLGSLLFEDCTINNALLQLCWGFLLSTCLIHCERRYD
jgi:hypothetical protein